MDSDLKEIFEIEYALPFTQYEVEQKRWLRLELCTELVRLDTSNYRFHKKELN